MGTSRGKSGAWLPACLVALLLAPAAASPAERWHASLGAATDDVWRGVSQTSGRAAAQASLSVSTSGGLYVGAWTSLAMRGSDLEPRVSPDAELDLFAGYRRALGDAWMLDLGVVRYTYPRDDRPLDYDHTELSMTLDYAGRMSATVAVSPDLSLYTTRGPAVERTAIAWELGFAQPVVRGLSLTAGVGYFDLSDLFETGYVYWNAGLTWEIGGMGLDVTYIRTDARGRELFLSRADPRTVVSLIVAF